MSLSVDIEKKFGEFTLRANFHSEHETIAILGASGCGKSVTLKCIAGILMPDRGKIILNHKVLFDSEQRINIPAKKRSVGYLFQNYALFPSMTVEENIAFGIKEAKLERVKKVQYYIERYYLKGYEKHYPHQLSGGQQQRTAIARMLAASPELLMFDEPFSALDTYLKWQLEKEVRKTIGEFEGNTLFVSHNRDEVYRIADKIVVMDKGKIEITEEKRKLFQSPRTLSATLLTGCKNVSEAVRLDDFTVRAIDWGVDLKLTEKVDRDIKYVGFRAHFFEPVSEDAEFNVVQCEEITEIEDVFSMQVIFRNGNTKKKSEWSTLQYETSKETWAEMRMKSKIYLRIPGDMVIQIF